MVLAKIRTAFHRPNRATRFVAGLVATSLGTTILGAAILDATILDATSLRNGGDKSSQGGDDKDGELGEHHIGGIRLKVFLVRVVELAGWFDEDLRGETNLTFIQILNDGLEANHSTLVGQSRT